MNDVRVRVRVCFLVCLSAFAAGCATRDIQKPRVQIDISQLPAEIFVEELVVEKPEGPLDVEALVRRAVEREPQISMLREAANVAWAQARTYVDLRDPELGLTFGRGTRMVERSWLVPRAEIMPALAYPSDGLFVTTHEESLAISTDRRIPRVLVPPGGENQYMTTSPRTYSGTVADSDSIRASIRFFPPNPWITKSRGAAAQANYAAVVSELYHAEWLLRCRIYWLLARLQYLEKDAGHLRELVEVRRTLSDDASVMASQQQMSAVDDVTAAQRHLQSLADLDKVHNEMSVLRNELEGYVGQSVTVNAETYPEEGFKTAEDARKLDLRKRALESRSDVAAAYWKTQVAQAALREAQAARVPWFTQVQGSYGRSTRRDRADQAWELRGGYAELDTDTSISIDDTEDTEWRIETAINIPLFSLGARATRVQEAECKRAIAELSASARLVMQGLTDAVSLLETAQQRDARVLEALGPRLQQTRDLLQLLRDKGGFGPVEQVRLKEVAIDMLRMSAQSRFDLIEASLRLEEMVGAPLVIAEEAPPPEVVVETPESAGDVDVQPEPKRPARLKRGIHR